MIGFRSTAVSSLATAATSLAVTVPSGVQAGDVMIAWFHLPAFNVTITRPTGWDVGRQVNIGSSATIAVFWRLAGASEPASYTFTFSSSQRAIATVTAYTGVSPTAPFGLPRTYFPAGSSGSFPLPAITAGLDNTWYLSAAVARTFADPAATFTIDEPTDAERSDANSGGAAAGKLSQAVYDSNGAITRGAVVDRVITASGSIYSGTQAAWYTELVSDETTGTGPLGFHGSASGHYGGSAPSATVNLDASYVQNGDLLVVAITRNGGTVTMPPGFTRLTFVATGSVDYQLWYKIANNEPATLPFTTTVGVGSQYLTVGMVAYSGANTSSPIGAWAFNQDANPTPTITTRTNGSWIFSAIFKNSSTTSFANADPLDAERVEQVAATYGLATYDSAREYAAGSSVSRTLTAPSGGTGFLRLIAEIRPGSAVPTGPTVTLNYRETPEAWTQYSAVPKTWTAGGEWVEVPGRYWDGSAYQDLPS
jgi:hypothetical protein